MGAKRSEEFQYVRESGADPWEGEGFDVMFAEPVISYFRVRQPHFRYPLDTPIRLGPARIYPHEIRQHRMIVGDNGDTVGVLAERDEDNQLPILRWDHPAVQETLTRLPDPHLPPWFVAQNLHGLIFPAVHCTKKVLPA